MPRRVGLVPTAFFTTKLPSTIRGMSLNVSSRNLSDDPKKEASCHSPKGCLVCLYRFNVIQAKVADQVVVNISWHDEIDGKHKLGKLADARLFFTLQRQLNTFIRETTYSTHGRLLCLNQVDREEVEHAVLGRNFLVIAQVVRPAHLEGIRSGLRPSFQAQWRGDRKDLSCFILNGCTAIPTNRARFRKLPMWRWTWMVRIWQSSFYCRDQGGTSALYIFV